MHDHARHTGAACHSAHRAPLRRPDRTPVQADPQSPASVLALQRTVGNAAVTRLLARTRQEGAEPAAATPVQRSATELDARALTSEEPVVTGQGGGLRADDPADRFEHATEDNARHAPSDPVPGTADTHADGHDHQPATTVVQRSVGFEFETGAETLAADPGLRQSERRGERVIKQFTTRGEWEGRDMQDPASTEYMGRGLRKKERVVTVGDLFTMEADEASTGGSNLEFVTAAFPENDTGRARLSEAMGLISRVAAALSEGSLPFSSEDVAGWVGGTAAQPPDRAEQATGKKRGPLEKRFKRFAPPQYVVKNVGNITANPQTTAGVQLSRIPQLIDAITNPPQSAEEPAQALNPMSQQDYQKVQATALQHVNGFLGNGFRVPSSDPNRAPAEPSGQLRGLLTLIATYLIGGNLSKGQSYVKGIVPLLARTDFATMYAQLPPEERENFAADPDIFIDMALRAAGLPTQDEPVFAGNIGLPPRANIRHVTRRTWLGGMVRGQDLMSADGYESHDWGRSDNAEIATEFESMGSMGSKTDPGNKPIVELRRMRKNVPYAEWALLAQTAFDAIRQANQ